MEAEESDGCVVGALGTVSDMFEKYAGKLNFTIRLEVIKNAALLGTAGLLPTESFGSLGTQIKGILWELLELVVAYSQG